MGMNRLAESALRAAGGDPSRLGTDFCALCGKPATEFKDYLSEVEHKISGMCQLCQDEFFTDSIVDDN